MAIFNSYVKWPEGSLLLSDWSNQGHVGDSDTRLSRVSNTANQSWRQAQLTVVGEQPGKTG